MPERVRAVWPMHKVAISGRYHDSLHTILTEWSLAQVFDALDVLDAIEDAQRARRT